MKTLVIGYGNTLRSDDGAGVRAAEMIAERYPYVDALALHELQPELAETIACYDKVVFVDASIRATQLQRRRLRPQFETSIRSTHSLTPEDLLSLSVHLYDRCPASAEIVEIPARNFRFGGSFSTSTLDAVNDCVQSFESRDVSSTDSVS